MMKSTKLTLAIALAFAAACIKDHPTTPGDNGIPPVGPDNPQQPEQPVQETPEGQSDFTQGQGNNQGSTQNGDAGASAGPAVPSATSEDSQDRSGLTTSTPRAIEESDIVKAFGSYLYVLNAYRGLQVIDLSTPDQPKLVSQVPFFGRPIEMYVRDGNAYVLISDYYRWWRRPDDSPGVFHGSTLKVVNVQNPSQPYVTNTFEFPGEVEDSRIVGSVLYIVANEYSWYYRDGSTSQRDQTTVVSVNIADPANIQKVQELNFPSNGYKTHINVTETGIFLAQSQYNWQNGCWNTGDCYSSTINYLDISDPNGAITRGATFTASGWVMDRWSMDRHGDTFRLISAGMWSSQNQTLLTYKINSVDSVTPLGRLDINTHNERLTAARFEQDRGYLVTAQNYDPLWTVDLSDPAHPTLKGQLEMPGFLMHIEPRGDRLIALGVHTENNNSNQVTRQFAVSLFNVADLSRPTLVKRETFGSDGWGWLPGDRDDFQKIFKVLDDMNLIMIPYTLWKRQTYKYESGVQLMDFTRDTLTKRGMISGVGAVLRAMPFANRLLTIGIDKFQVVDATNRDQPRVTAVIDLARNVHSFELLDATYAVQFAGSWIEGDTELVVTRVDAPNDSSPVARVHVGAPNAKFLRNGRLVYVLSSDSETKKTRLQVVDLTDPTVPRARGSLDIGSYVYISPYYWDYYGYGNEAALMNGTTIVLHKGNSYEWVCDSAGTNCHYDYDQYKLFVLDASNPDAPRLASTIPLSNAHWAWGLKTRGSYAYISSYTYICSNGATYSRNYGCYNGYGYGYGYGYTTSTSYFLNRFNLANPSTPVALPQVNIPGRFLDATADGRYIFTIDQQYASNGYRTTLYSLALIGDHAYLRSTAAFDGYVYAPLFSNGYFYATTYDYGYYRGYYDSSRFSYKLQIIDARNPRALSKRGSIEAAGYGWIIGVQGNYAFYSNGWMDGLSVYNVSDADHPRFERAFRTQGWVERVTLAGDTAYFASGFYGVQAVSLQGLPAPVVLD